jgi:hypothetical protein
MKMNFVEGQGKSATSFAYTVGFGAIGGKELLIIDIHRSMSESNIRPGLKYMFDRHQDHPLADGHTIDGGDGVGYIAHAPDSTMEATLLKATKTLEATRLYGLTGYDILILTPACINQNVEKRMTREEILLSGVLGDDAQPLLRNSIQPVVSKTKKLESCGWCHKVRDTAKDAPLSMCAMCQNTYYCCRDHQRMDWAHHKQLAGAPEMILMLLPKHLFSGLSRRFRVSKRCFVHFKKVFSSYVRGEIILANVPPL